MEFKGEERRAYENNNLGIRDFIADHKFKLKKREKVKKVKN